MDTANAIICPECGGVLREGKSCEDYFGELIALEFVDPAAGMVHHLTVACYMIQHGRYTDEGVAWIRTMLENVLEKGLSPVDVRKQSRAEVDSGRRTWKVIRPTSAPLRPNWSVTIADIAQGTPGRDTHCERVTKWAHSVLAEMRT
jgi:hypothetical protein